MSAEAFDAGAWLDVMAELLELPIADEFRAGVLANLEVTARHAAILEGFLPEDHLEPAPVFGA